MVRKTTEHSTIFRGSLYRGKEGSLCHGMVGSPSRGIRGSLSAYSPITIENKKIDYPELNFIFPPIEGYLNDATHQLRLLSRSLNKDYINNVGLLNAIQIETERLQHLQRFQIHLQNHIVLTGLDKNQELVVFRIFQEVVQNSIKHAKAKNFFIILKDLPGFELQMIDDGEGFDVVDIMHSPKASGLKNILKRAKMADMECIIDSSTGNGCKYVLRQKLKDQ